MATVFVDQLPGNSEARPLYRGFVAALQAPDLSVPIVIRTFDNLETSMSVPYYWKYEALMRLSQPELALDVVWKAAASGPLETTQPLFSLAASEAWSDERFADVADLLGLTEYWRATEQPDICAGLAKPARFCQ